MTAAKPLVQSINRPVTRDTTQTTKTTTTTRTTTTTTTTPVAVEDDKPNEDNADEDYDEQDLNEETESGTIETFSNHTMVEVVTAIEFYIHEKFLQGFIESCRLVWVSYLTSNQSYLIQNCSNSQTKQSIVR